MGIDFKNWKGDEFKKFIDKTVAERLEACLILLKNAIKVDLSLPSNKGRTPSRPGEPPHKDTGRLRASISHEFNKQQLRGWVGTNLVYGVYLEVGTRAIAARPYFRKAYYENIEKIKSIMRAGR